MTIRWVHGVAELLPALVKGVPAMLSDVADALRDVAPEYADALTEHDEEVLRTAGTAMLRLVTQAERDLGPGPSSPEPDARLVHDLFESLGRSQWRAGFPLPTLLAAFQVGARVTWRHVAGAAVATGVEPSVLADLGGEVFELVDQLSSASTAGYLAEQEEAALARQRLREELVELLLSDRSDTAAVRLAARRAGWRLPRTATVVLAGVDDEASRAALARLEPGALRFRSWSLQGVVVPDADTERRRDRLTRLLVGCAALVGPTVPLEDLPHCARMTRLAAELQRAGVLRDRPVFVDEHVGELIVHREPQLLDDLRRRRLAPLDGATPGVRTALRDTLRSWLVHMGDRRRVAADLGVHPQTVRYRMARLRELFGDDLDDPRARRELLLVLAWD